MRVFFKTRFELLRGEKVADLNLYVCMYDRTQFLHDFLSLHEFKQVVKLWLNVTIFEVQPVSLNWHVASQIICNLRKLELQQLNK